MLRNLPIIKQFLLFRDTIRNINNEITDIKTEIINIRSINIDTYIQKHMYENPRYQDAKRLNRFEYQVYSQNGEDGIITEIFERIGITNKFFVEFGASVLMNNTTLLLLKNWTGVWIEAVPDITEGIKAKHRALIENKRLLIKNAFVDSENIEKLFKELNVPEEFDLLSIDIDGNDYWIWKAIENYRPRVVVIEYNAKFGPDMKWVMKYNPNHRWSGTCYHGASLKSLEMLGLTKGYKLVGCDFNGVNAFFVRENLIGEKFLAPFTAENHYEPPRYYLARQVGHARDLADFESV